MRDILFRGKRVDNGEWVYGLPYEANEKVQSIRVKEDCGEFMSYMTFAVVPNTVGQYTGLTDANGAKIFEGDIIRSKRGVAFAGQYDFVVKFDNGTFYGQESLLNVEPIHFECCIVIGNIYDKGEG